MSFNFVIPEFNIGGTGTPPLQFYRRGFNIGGRGSSPTWQDIIISGTTALTLVNAKANGLNYLKLFGKCEQDGTPTPSNPVDIVCNNGVIKVKDDELPVGYRRLTGISYDSNFYYDTRQKLYGTDTLTVRLSGTSTNGRNVIGAYSGTGDDARNFSLFIYGNNSTSNSYLRHGTELARPRYGSGTRTLVMSPTGTDGFTTDVTYNQETFETTSNFWIGGLPNSSSTKYDGNIEGNITVSTRLKYIPVEREIDGEIGYYETFNSEFLEKQGTGTPVSMGYDTSHLTEIYIDGTVETVSVFKNLVDEVVEGKFVRAGNASETNPKGSEKSDNNWCCTEYIAVEPNTEYTTVSPSYITATGAGLVFFSDTTVESAISGVTAQRQGGAVYIFTTPEDCHFLRFSYPRETGLKAVMYENSNLQTATAEPLFAVGDYKDEQEVLTGAVTRNVGIKVFDGTENWQDSSTSSMIRYRVLINDTVGGSSRSEVLCSHFDYISTGQDVGGAFLSTKYLYLIPDQTVTTVADFKQFLADQCENGTPVTVIYPLATPTTETVTPQPMQIQAGTNIVEITQASIDNLELEVSYKAGVEVTVEEIEAVNNDESVEVTING